MSNEVALLTVAELETITRMERTTIYRRIKAGDFPAPLQISPRKSLWRLSDVNAWRESRVQGCRPQVARPAALAGS
jgi:prophage regulatory protein